MAFDYKKEYKENGWKTEIYFVFVTLEDSKKSNEEFDSFNYDKKLHLYWKGKTSIQEKILNILDLERIGEIDPISEDFKFLIKSFLSFIKTESASGFNLFPPQLLQSEKVIYFSISSAKLSDLTFNDSISIDGINPRCLDFSENSLFGGK